MDQKTQSAAANRVYQDFEPFFEWVEDAGSDTLVLMLPGEYNIFQFYSICIFQISKSTLVN